MSGLITFFLCCSLVHPQQEEKKPAAGKTDSAMPEMMPGMQEIVMRWAMERQRFMQEWGPKWSAAKAEEEKKTLVDEAMKILKQNDRTMITAIMPMIRKEPGHRGAAFGLWRVIGTEPNSAEGHEAAELLLQHHPEHEHFGYACLYLARNATPWVITFLNKTLDRLPQPEAKARIKAIQAEMYLQLMEKAAYSKLMPAKEREQVSKQVGIETLDWYKSLDPQQMEKQATTLFEELLAQHPDVKLPMMNNETIGSLAQRTLHELRHFALGKPAQDIVGKDIEGKPLKLSEYRGKVVVIYFWGTWCKPCLEQIPTEKALVTRLAGKPFALLGIVSDTDLEKTRTFVKDRQMTWPQWWDNGERNGPIAKAWNIRVYPTNYVLDQHGIIRAKQVHHEALGEIVDRLLGEMK